MRTACRWRRRCSSSAAKRPSPTTPTPMTASVYGCCGRRRPARCRRSSSTSSTASSGLAVSGDGFKDKGRIIIVGASLAGLRAAEALRKEGFRGHLTIIGDEPGEPYDRPPLSKQILAGWVRADATKLPRMCDVDAEWRLGVAATGLDRVDGLVRLADGSVVEGDGLLI